MWSFSLFTQSREVKSESIESLCSSDRNQRATSSSEDNFEDCDEELEICSSPNFSVEESGLAKLSIHSSLSTIASPAVSMDRESYGNGANVSYGDPTEDASLSPAKRLKSSCYSKIVSPAGVRSQASISRTWSPDDYALHGAASPSLENFRYNGFASPLPKSNGCAESAYDVKRRFSTGCTLAQQVPLCRSFPRNCVPEVKHSNSELLSPDCFGNQSFSPGLAPASKCPSPAFYNDIRHGVHLDSSDCGRKDSTVVLPAARHVETYTSRASSPQFGNAQMPPERNSFVSNCFQDREFNAVNSGPPSVMTEKDVPGPTGGGNSSFSRRVPGIKRSGCVPRSTQSFISSNGDSSSGPAVWKEQSGFVKREAVPTSKPEKCVCAKCEKSELGSGVLHSVSEPWRSQDELIEEDEYRRVDPALRRRSGVQGLEENIKNDKSNWVASLQEVLTEQILEERKNPNSAVEPEQWPPLTEQLQYLGTLDFPSKVFPVLTRLRGKSLEEVFSLQELQSIGRQPNEGVSQYLWYMDGLKGCKTAGLPTKGKRCDFDIINYVCRVRPTGELIFELVEEKQASSLLQRTLGFDKVLKVIFDGELAEDGKKARLSQAHIKRCSQLATRGIFVGLRRYQYFGNVKCFFVCTGSLAEADKHPHFRRFSSVAEARCLFMHIHQTESVAKYIARMQLVLSKTATIDLDWSQVCVREKMDMHCKDESDNELNGISTDGTGFISTDLARKIPPNILNGRQKTEDDGNEDYPSLIQVRVFHEGAAYKGTLLASNALPANTIEFYTSMRKVKRDEKVAFPSINSLEVVNTSRKPRRVQGVYTAKLSRDLIMLLTACGVPDKFFTDLVKDAIEKNNAIFHNDDVATDEVVERGEKAEMLLKMIAAGIPLDEPFLRKSLLDITVRKLQNFSTGKVNLSNSFWLLGTADPTGTLKRNQVAITLSDGFIYCPKLLVYRAPGRHPGDIHVFEATCNSGLQSVNGDGKYVIYFSTQGPRPIAEEIGKGDLDGDRYWICKNTELISLFKEYPCRWERPLSEPVDKKPDDTRLNPMMQKPAEVSSKKLEETLFKAYMKDRFEQMSHVGKISNMCLKHMDRYLHERKTTHLDAALKLVTLYYDALDASKSGKEVRFLDEPLPNVETPHYMKIPGEETYHSKSTPGQIYDLANSEDFRTLRLDENFKPDEIYLVEGYLDYYKVWDERYKDYKHEMSWSVSANQSGNPETDDRSAPDQVYLKYRKELYGTVTSFKECRRQGTKKQQQVLQEASAIYAVVYSSAVVKLDMEPPRLSFAWNVAGEALCFLYAEKQPGQILPWSEERFKSVCRKKKKKADSAARKKLFSD